jgi:hypothetical protein
MHGLLVQFLTPAQRRKTKPAANNPVPAIGITKPRERHGRSPPISDNVAGLLISNTADVPTSPSHLGKVI